MNRHYFVTALESGGAKDGLRDASGGRRRSAIAKTNY